MFKEYQLKGFFIFISVFTVGNILSRFSDFSHNTLWDFTDYILRMIIVFGTAWYIHAYFMVHKFSALNIKIRSLLSIAVTTAVTLLYLHFFHYLPDTAFIDRDHTHTGVSGLIIHGVRAFFISIITYVVFYSIYTYLALQATRLQNEILGQQHLKAQIMSLQQQVSPHFLFNSLSILKTIAVDKPTKNYVLQLSSIYRYVLNFNEKHLTELKDELAFIRSYLFILAERYEESIQVNIDVPALYQHYLMPPLSLQLVVENAVKHNAITAENPLCISISANETPALVVQNNYQPKPEPAESTGQGLKNISERYQLLGESAIRYENDGKNFTVILPLLSTGYPAGSVSTSVADIQ